MTLLTNGVVTSTRAYNDCNEKWRGKFIRTRPDSDQEKPPQVLIALKTIGSLSIKLVFEDKYSSSTNIFVPIILNIQNRKSTHGGQIFLMNYLMGVFQFNLECLTNYQKFD